MSQSVLAATGVVNGSRVKVIGAIMWICFIKSAMIPGFRLSNRRGFAGLEMYNTMRNLRRSRSIAGCRV